MQVVMIRILSSEFVNRMTWGFYCSIALFDAPLGHIALISPLHPLFRAQEKMLPIARRPGKSEKRHRNVRLTATERPSPFIAA